MSRPTFTVEVDLVRIYIRGIPHEKGRYYAKDDQGIVKELLDKMIKGELPKDVYMESCGAGQMISWWHKDDAPKIIEWLKQRADKVDDHPFES